MENLPEPANEKLTDRTRLDALLAAAHAAGVTFVLLNDRAHVRPPGAWLSLPEDARAGLLGYREEIAARLREARSVMANPAAAKPKPEEPEPEVYAYGRLVTEPDVTEALRMLGDDAVEDYRAGRMTKAEAFGIARQRLRELAERRTR